MSPLETNWFDKDHYRVLRGRSTIAVVNSQAREARCLISDWRKKMYYHPKVSREAAPSRNIFPSASGADELCRLVVQPSVPRVVAAVCKVLIPVDASRHALQAVTHLIGSAHRSPTPQVHLVNVQPLVMQGDFALNGAVAVERRARLAAAHEVLERARTLLDRSGIPCEKAVLFGNPARSIARYASEHGCDAILMGTRGLGSLKGLLLGSVASKVVNMADVPVTLVKSVAPERPSRAMT